MGSRHSLFLELQVFSSVLSAKTYSCTRQDVFTPLSIYSSPLVIYSSPLRIYSWCLLDAFIKGLFKCFTCRLGKNKLHELFKIFSAKFFLFSVKFGFLNVQFRNYLKNVIFIAYKWCKICKLYVNSIVVSCSTSQNGEKCIWFTLFCRNFQFVVIYAFFFCQIFTSKVSEFTKNDFFQVCLNIWPFISFLYFNIWPQYFHKSFSL